MLKTQELLRRLGRTNDTPKHPMEKMQIFLEYIGENMENNNDDEQAIRELVFAAKKNIAETIINLREDEGLPENSKQLYFHMNLTGENVELGNTMTSMFLLAPETMFKNLAEANLQDNPEDAALNETEEEKAARKAKLRATFDLLAGKEDVYTNFEAEHSELLNDLMNIAEKYPDKGDEPIKAVVKSCKPGFFERVFKRTSQEYKDFEATFKRRANEEATRDELDNAAKAYLMHKIPGYNGEGIPNIQDIQRLSGKSKTRALLAYNTLKASEKSRVYEEKLNNIMGVATTVLSENGQDATLRQMREQNRYVIHGLDEHQAQANNQQQANQQQENQVQEEEPSFEIQEYIAKDLAAEDEQGMEDYNYADESSMEIDNDEVQKEDEELGLD